MSGKGPKPTRTGSGPAPDAATGDASLDIGYADAVEELEAILAGLERDDLDIDVLGPQVQRAAALIRVCRDRIDAARHEVEQIVADLDGPAPGGEAEVGRTPYD